MRTLIVFLLSFPIYLQAQEPSPTVNSDSSLQAELTLVQEEVFSSEAVIQFFHDYIATYNRYLADSNDLSAMESAAQHFNMPVMQFPTKSGPTVTLEHTKMVDNLTSFTHAIKNTGVTSLRWEQLSVVPLRDNMALANNIVNALDVNGKILRRLTTLYIVVNTDNGWKIAAITSYPSDNLFKIEQL